MNESSDDESRRIRNAMAALVRAARAGKRASPGPIAQQQRKPQDPKPVVSNVVANAPEPPPARAVQETRPTRKIPISIRLDADLLEHLKSGGRGWQTRVNACLREAVGLNDQKTDTNPSDPIDFDARQRRRQIR